MSSRLFDVYPIGGSRATSAGPLPVPYHVYSGEVLFLGGSVERGAVQHFTVGQGLHWVENRKGRVLAGLWICRFTEASLGAHCEFQLSLAVSRSMPLPLPSGNPFELLRLIVLEPALRLYSAVLWNDMPGVVTYNREVLGLDAQLCQAHISRGEEGGFFSFRFEDEKNDLICQGDVVPPREQPIWDALLADRALGKAGRKSMAAAPWLGAQVMAPGGVRFTRPCEAQTYLQADRVVLARYAAADARLEFGSCFPAGLDFRPTFLEHFTGFQFVYLPPYNCGDVFDGPNAA